MENLDDTIQQVDCSSDMIKILYSSGAIESLSNDSVTYNKMYETWIKNNDVFITDKYKIEMRNISLVYLQKNKACLNELSMFFQQKNNDKVKDFLTYMRNRKTLLETERQKWNKNV